MFMLQPNKEQKTVLVVGLIGIWMPIVLLVLEVGVAELQTWLR